jgi:hypothetical protein
MNTAVYMLRIFQMGIRLCELEELEQGMILDMMTESANDSCEYPKLATKEDFARF